MSQLATEARAIADAVEPKVGFDVFSLISLLLPVALNILSQCQKATPITSTAPEQTPQMLLGNHFDPNESKFDDHAVNVMRPHTRRCAFHSGHPALPRAKIDAISIATLERGRNMDDTTMATCMAETA